MVKLVESLSSVLPIMTFIVLVSIFNKRISTAAIVSFFVSLAVGILIMNSRLSQIGINCVEGIWNTGVIFIVIFSALLLNNIMDKSGTLENISEWIGGNVKGENNRVILVGFTFTSFLQGITGFGVPVAVAAPILVSFGIKPVKAVVICILGHAWGGTFGTLGIAWNSMFMQIQDQAIIDIEKTILTTCILLGIYNLICGILICLIGNKHVNMKDVFTVIIISLIQGGGQLLLAYINVDLACFAAATLSMVVIYLIDKSQYREKKIAKPLLEKEGTMNTFFPFIFLGVIVCILLIPTPINNWIGEATIGMPLPLLDGSGGWRIYGEIKIFTHSGTILFFTAIVSLLFYVKKDWMQKDDIVPIMRGSLKNTINVTIPVLFLVVTSRIMTGTGQIDILAEYIGHVFCESFGFASPYIGILGSFISSSNMSSNIMFTNLQLKIAQINGLNTAVILAAQTAGGAVGNLVSTNNIVLGLATVDRKEEEQLVMRQMVLISVITGGVLGIVTAFMC